jgi:hypothetical protein
MPYIIMRRTDIPNGVLQVIDLKPNTSQRSLIYDPGDGQSGYVRNIPEDQSVATVSPGAAILTVADYCGLAAYLIDNVEDDGGAALTAAVANASADSMIAKAVAGTDLTLAEMDLSLTANGVADATAGTGVEANTSTGLFTEVMSLLQGSKYLLPGGSTVDTDGSTFNPTRQGSFSFLTRTYYATGAFNISNGEGNLADYKATTFEYEGTLGAALVVYDDTGVVA